MANLYTLPIGWQWEKLAKLIRPTSTTNPLNFPNKKFTYIDIASINNEVFKITSPNEILGKDAPSRARKAASKGDILFATTRPNLKNIAVIEQDFDNLVCSTGFCVISVDPKKIDKTLLFHCLTTDFVQRQIEPLIRGAQYPAISDKDLLSTQIPLPPLPTQQKIVAKIEAAFARLDEAIERQKQNIQRTENLKKAVLEEVFAEGTWEKKKIEEIAHVKGGKRLPMGKTLSVEKTRFPYIRVADFNDSGTVDLEKIKYLDEETQKSIKNYTITSDDLYISIAGTIGLTGIIPSELNGANLTENAAKLVFKDPTQVDKRFVYYFTISKYFIDQVSDATKTVAQPKLALTRLAQIQIPVPKPISVQRQIVAHLDRAFAHADELLAAQRGRLARLEALKKSILEEAFRGELVS